jgi:uncharacterized membrane protein
MSELIVFGFKTETGAAEMRDALARLQKQHLITLDDAAIVVRRQDGKVKVKQAVDLVGEGALGGAFWGMLIGLLFFMPWMGLAIGGISGALAGKLSDIGIDDDFIKEVGAAVEPRNSALFLLVRDVAPDKVLDELAQFDAKLLRTSLSTEKEARLRATFGVEAE